MVEIYEKYDVDPRNPAADPYIGVHGTPSDGQVPTWVAANDRYEPQTPSSGVSELDDLSDVDAPSPSDGHVLTFNTASGKWEPQAPGGGSGGSGSYVDPNEYYEPPASPNALDDEFTAATGMTWRNQNGATAIIGKNKRLILTVPAGDQKHILERTAPATPYTFGVALTNYATSSSHIQGIVVLESSTNKMHIFEKWQTTDAAVARFSGVGPSTFAGFDGGPSGINVGRHCWQWITDDGTNLKFWYSPDGPANPILFASISRTAYLAGGADRIGIVVDEVLGSASVTCAFHHFRVTPTNTP
jgi:hypothetical protein